jgi:hypothetical protein
MHRLVLSLGCELEHGNGPSDVGTIQSGIVEDVVVTSSVVPNGIDRLRTKLVLIL